MAAEREWTFPGSGLALALGLAALSTLLGLAATYVGPVAVPVLVALALPLVVVRWPRLAGVFAILVGAVYGGVILAARLEVGGLPVSALDGAVVLLVAAATASWVRSRGSSGTPTWTGIGQWALLLAAAGALVGWAIGLSKGAPGYQLTRTTLIEIELLLAAGAALVLARNVHGWSDSLRIAIYVAAGAAALQTILTVASLELLGVSPWQRLGYDVQTVGFSDALGGGELGAARDNFLPAFIMVPAVAMAIVRHNSLDLGLVGLLLAAIAVSLSRGLWVATGLTIIICGMVALRRAAIARDGPYPLWGIAAGAVACLTVMGVLAGTDILSARFDQSVSGSSDVSRLYRETETDLLLERILATPSSAILGLGAGQPIDSPFASIAGIDDPNTAIPENHVLGLWSNFGIIGLAGVFLLFASATLAGARQLVARSDADMLNAAGLALVPLFATGWFGGTLLQPFVTLSLMVIAGSVLGLRARMSQFP